MIELQAKSAAHGLLPLTTERICVTELWPVTLTSVAPFQGQGVAVADALGLGLPAVGRSVESETAAVIWTGRDQYFLLGSEAPDLPAAMTDQSDAWCVVDLSGPDMLDCLARLCPLDVAQMEDGDVARSLLGHMHAIIWRREAGFRLMIFRAFVQTLIRELGEVAQMLDGRHKLQNSHAAL